MNEPFTMHELERALARAKRKSAPGPDGITFQCLRNLDQEQRAKLLAFYNLLWERGTLPDSFTRAYVCPILKRGKPANKLGSYRPISLTSAVGKLFEMMVLARLEWLAAEQSWNPEQQIGYRRGRSTADCIADVVSTFEQAKGSKHIMFLVLLDVEKAFHALPHATIHAALDRCQVMGRMSTYLDAFLCNRSLQVRVGKTLSSAFPVTAGVP